MDDESQQSSKENIKKMKELEPEKKIHQNEFGNSYQMKPEFKRKVLNELRFFETDESVNVTVLENRKHDGSDSGVEMNGKCHCSETDGDGAFVTSSNSSIVSGHSSSPCCGDIDDLITNDTNFHISSDLQEYQLPLCDGNSENGSESSSVGSSRKCCRPNCIGLKKSCLYGKPSPYRSLSVNGRKPSPNNLDAEKAGQKASPVQKYDTYCYRSPSLSNSSVSSRIKTFENRSRAVRSVSSSRCKTTTTVNEEKRWPMDGRISVRSKPCSPLSNSDSENKSSSIQERCTTLPRRQSKVNESRNSTSREPSLNRAASLRKKFVENNLMTTSLTIPSSTSPINTKTPPIYYHNSRASKTKIYHEISVQTSLTGQDLNKLSAGLTTKSLTDTALKEDFSNQVDLEVDKVHANKLKSMNEELKKVKTDNDKQRNVIEWLETELSTNKDEKLKVQNHLASLEERLKLLLRHKDCGTLEDTITKLEREVKYSDEVISQQQKEINELQEMCCVLKQDLEKSYCTQRSLLDTQKASEFESMELQEFLQAEKSMLSDSLRDTEAELNICKSQLSNIEQELANTTDQCSHLVRVSEQQRQENLLLQVRLSSLEHRSKDLLLQQGAAVSSASVSLSGLASRFEFLLRQLIAAYNITDTDLKDVARFNNASNENRVEDQKYSDTQQLNNDNVSVNSELCRMSCKKFISALISTIHNTTTQTSLYGHSASENKDCAKKNIAVISPSLKISNFDEYDSNISTPYLLKPNVCLNRHLSKSSLTVNDEVSDLPDSSSKRNSLPVNLNDESLDSSKTEFNISESLNNLSETILTRQNVEGFSDDSFLKEYVKHDISLIGQITDIDNIFTKLLRAILIIQYSPYLSRQTYSIADLSKLKKNDDSVESIRSHYETDGNQIASEDNITFSENNSPLHSSHSQSELLSRIQRQQNIVCKVLTMLHNMKDSVDAPVDLQKILDELETINIDYSSEAPSHYSSFSSSLDK